MTTSMGWYVKVTTDETHDGVYNTVLYIAGYPTPDDAIAAVTKARSWKGERYDAVGTEILSGIGPQPEPNEVRLIPGAV